MPGSIWQWLYLGQCFNKMVIFKNSIIFYLISYSKTFIMLRKSFLILLLAFFAKSTFAQATIDVFINGIKAGQYLIKNNQTDSGGIAYKKSVYKNIDRLSIQIKGKSVEGNYLRKVQVMGEDATPIFIADETLGAVGQFVLTDKAIFKRLSKGKTIKLYVEKTPANTKSKEAVRLIYIGMLSRQ